MRCSPLVREPLSETQSVDLAAVFKALADPIRLRLFSLIASPEHGEACVCGISPVSYTHPTLPTSGLGEVPVVAGTLKKNTNQASKYQSKNNQIK